MSNNPQPNSLANANNTSITQPQESVPPMARAPVPGHIREHLRPSTSFPTAPTHHGRHPQYGPMFQRPLPNYAQAFADLNQTIHAQHARPYHQSQVQYGQRQTHVAEYGRAPPIFVTPPPTPDLVASALYRMQQPLAVIDDLPRAPAALPGRRAAAPNPASVQPISVQQAEGLAFQVEDRTGLNQYGAPPGYMPAKFVDKIPGAWMEGEMKWVPTWDR